MQMGFHTERLVLAALPPLFHTGIRSLQYSCVWDQVAISLPLLRPRPIAFPSSHSSTE